MPVFYNSLTKKKDRFAPIAGNGVGLYTCGPTVYNYAHIGNLRTYVFEDILKRVLLYNGYDVNHVMNITDVGHLSSDGDTGEDKMEKGARREGKSAWDIAKFYTEAFQRDMAALNITEPNVWCKATDHIPEQIALVETLTDNGYTYTTSDGIYFDTTKDPDYGILANLRNQELKAGARVELGEKRNVHDFALWKFTAPGEKRQMEWFAFGQMGFPGWHIECSAMAMKYLGDHFDIHCGGIDHVPVHHTNEIAQTESATGKTPWVNVWMHGEFLKIEDAKMAKSGENFLTLQSLIDNGYSPLAYRYFLLQAHYRKQLAFSWEALDAAAEGLKRLRKQVQEMSAMGEGEFLKKFEEKINDDLNIPEALALLWTGVKENNVSKEMAEKMDAVLGLDLFAKDHDAPMEIPSDIQKLLDARAAARAEKNWKESDRLRDGIREQGFEVEDSADGQRVAPL